MRGSHFLVTVILIVAGIVAYDILRSSSEERPPYETLDAPAVDSSGARMPVREVPRLEGVSLGDVMARFDGLERRLARLEARGSPAPLPAPVPAAESPEEPAAERTPDTVPPAAPPARDLDRPMGLTPGHAPSPEEARDHEARREAMRKHMQEQLAQYVGLQAKRLGADLDENAQRDAARTTLDYREKVRELLRQPSEGGKREEALEALRGELERELRGHVGSADVDPLIDTLTARAGFPSRPSKSASESGPLPSATSGGR